MRDSYYHQRKPIWQEVIHKARVRLCRAARRSSLAPGPPHPVQGPSSDEEYSYSLEFVEDFDDGRVHDEAESSQAGILENIPIRELSKVFYTNTGRILNIGNVAESDNGPILLLKRDLVVPATFHQPSGTHVDNDAASLNKSDQAQVDQQLLTEAHPQGYTRSSPRRFPAHLDHEWIALEVFDDEVDDDTEDGEEGETNSALEDGPKQSRPSLDSTLVAQLRNLTCDSSAAEPPDSLESQTKAEQSETQRFVSRSPFGAITTSLSLIEMLIRLAGLQEFQQASHLSIPDHVLTFFLEETSSTGLVGEAQWRARSEAKKRMGFDPYTDGGGNA